MLVTVHAAGDRAIRVALHVQSVETQGERQEIASAGDLLEKAYCRPAPRPHLFAFQF
jgi:hypothetical protein